MRVLRLDTYNSILAIFLILTALNEPQKMNGNMQTMVLCGEDINDIGEAVLNHWLVKHSLSSSWLPYVLCVTMSCLTLSLYSLSTCVAWQELPVSRLTQLTNQSVMPAPWTSSPDPSLALEEDYTTTPRTHPVSHPPLDSPLCPTCRHLDLSFFDPSCPGCAEILTSRETSIGKDCEILGYEETTYPESVWE